MNIDDFVFAPVMAGDWKQRETWDGTYTMDDLLDWHEMQAVKQENERLWHEAEKRRQGK